MPSDRSPAGRSSSLPSKHFHGLNECLSSGLAKHLLLAFNGLDKPSV